MSQYKSFSKRCGIGEFIISTRYHILSLQIEKTVCTLIKPKVEDEEYRLRYITGGMLSTAELSILQAHRCV